MNDTRGDLARHEMHRKTHEVLRCIENLGIYTPNQSGYPVIEVPLARHEDIDAVGRFLFDRGIYVTMAAYPLVPKDEVGFRIQVTTANGDDEIDRLCEVLVDSTASSICNMTTTAASSRPSLPDRGGRDQGTRRQGAGKRRSPLGRR